MKESIRALIKETPIARRRKQHGKLGYQLLISISPLSAF